ncbi:MAG: methyltransferase domain-containing protein [candidate division NC10 bacterium]
MADSTDSRVEEHYTHRDLAAAIFEALAAAGKNVNNLTLQDLAPVDEFHVRGQEATAELARAARLDATMHVLDVGSGVGGPSRYLAAEFGCRVTGLDLTEEYCRTAQVLADRIGLSDRILYRQGNALNMPFDAESFEVAWTQHTAMNIEDKSSMYSEMWRVVKRGGLIAIYDILAGDSGPVHFPVPWAREPSISFLATPDELHDLLEEVGFEILRWRDTTDLGREWFRAMRRRMREEGAAPLGFHVLLGPDFQTMTQNMIRNLDENRIALIEVLARKP